MCACVCMYVYICVYVCVCVYVFIQCTYISECSYNVHVYCYVQVIYIHNHIFSLFTQQLAIVLKTSQQTYVEQRSPSSQLSLKPIAAS